MDYAGPSDEKLTRILTWLRLVLEVLLICHDFRSSLLFRFGVVEIKAKAFDRETTCCLEQVIAGKISCRSVLPRIDSIMLRCERTCLFSVLIGFPFEFFILFLDSISTVETISINFIIYS